MVTYGLVKQEIREAITEGRPTVDILKALSEVCWEEVEKARIVGDRKLERAWEYQMEYVCTAQEKCRPHAKITTPLV